MDRLAAEEAALTQQGAQADEDAAQAREAEESAQAPPRQRRERARRGAGRGVGPRRPSPGALDAAAEEGRRLTRLEAEYAAIERERGALSAAGFEETERAARAQAVAERPRRSPPPSAKRRRRRSATPRLARVEARHRGPLAEAERAAQRLETEARTVAGLLGSDSSGPWPRAVDAVSVARGYEAALGAALGDDLDASVDEAAPAHWSLIAPADEDPSLPVGADPLAARVSAPPALARRLAQVGVVARADGKRLAQRSQARPAAGLARRRSLALGRLRRRRRSAERGRAASGGKESPRRP